MSPRQVASTTLSLVERAAENSLVKAFARIGMGIATLIGIPGLFWALSTADNMRTALITMQGQLAGLQAVAAEVYTSQQAARDWQFQTQRDASQDGDRQRIENRVDSLEGWMRSRG